MQACNVADKDTDHDHLVLHLFNEPNKAKSTLLSLRPLRPFVNLYPSWIREEARVGHSRERDEEMQFKCRK